MQASSDVAPKPRLLPASSASLVLVLRTTTAGPAQPLACPKPPVPSSQREPSGRQQIFRSPASRWDPSTLRGRPRR